MNSVLDVWNHRKVTQAVHEEGRKILMQILHAEQESLADLMSGAASETR